MLVAEHRRLAESAHMFAHEDDKGLQYVLKQEADHAALEKEPESDLACELPRCLVGKL